MSHLTIKMFGKITKTRILTLEQIKIVDKHKIVNGLRQDLIKIKRIRSIIPLRIINEEINEAPKSTTKIK